MGNVRLFGGVFGCGEVLWPGAVDLLAGNALGGKAVSWIKPRLTTHGQLLLATPTPPPPASWAFSASWLVSAPPTPR